MGGVRLEPWNLSLMNRLLPLEWHTIYSKYFVLHLLIWIAHALRVSIASDSKSEQLKKTYDAQLCKPLDLKIYNNHLSKH